MKKRGFKHRLLRYGVPLAMGAALVGVSYKFLAKKPLAHVEPPAKKRVLEQYNALRELGRRRCLVLNPFVVQNKIYFEQTMDSFHRNIFSQFKRVGREEGGVIFFIPSEKRFHFQTFESPEGKRMESALRKAERGDFSGSARIIDALGKWQWTDTLTLPSGQEIKLTGDFLVDRFKLYMALWEKRRALQQQGRVV
ncbi:MAG: hypothetical protein JW772_00155 [Candidatus Diapherotrites archaeon]|nr:hypothetical protein [Candidatus Diapherotrites archaeon]